MEEPETVLQPSLHTCEEFDQLVFSECEARGINCADIQRDIQEADEVDRGQVSYDGSLDAMDRLHDAGYANVLDNDCFLIWPKGYKPTDEEYGE